MTKQRLLLAGRKWRRQFNEAVLQSIAKTLTEPITNAYDSFKRIYGKEDASTGLVEAMLKVRAGDHFLHEKVIQDLPQRPARTITVKISRTERRGLQRKECWVADKAEGMTAAELNQKFSKYGSEKSGASAGHAVRGLFGQGILDVVYSHTPGVIRTIKNGKAAECTFTWSVTEEPEYEVLDRGEATKKLRKEWGIEEGNGTVVSFLLADRCRLPQSSEVLLARLSSFYMLRLINADPFCDVVVEQVRHGATETNSLKYFFPHGQVVKNFQTHVMVGSFPPIKVEGVVIRAESALPTSDDDRATGLLIVDETDAVYDQTFFRFDSALYLDHIYGVLRLTGVRDILRARLEQGEALLTESRDGFDKKKDLYRALDEVISPILEPLFKKEMERRSEPTRKLSESAEKKLKKAFERLNNLFEDVTKQQPTGGGTGGEGLKVPETLEFEEPRVQLRVGTPRYVRLLANAAVVNAESPVLIDSDSAAVKVEPTSGAWKARPDKPEFLTLTVALTGEKVGFQANVQALAQGNDGSTLEAKLQVTDVMPTMIVEPPPSGLEFSPRESYAAPSRRGSLGLLINPAVLPLGTEIIITRSVDGTVMLVDDDNDDVKSLHLTFKKAHLIAGGKVGRISIGYRGYGFGQSTSVIANSFIGKNNIRAEAEVRIQEPKAPTAGVFRDVEYKDLPAGMKKSSSEFDPTTGVIRINRLHPVNRAYFGVDETSFRTAIDENHSAQSRLAEVILDQCLYHTAAVAYQNGRILLEQEDVISAIRKWMEQFKFDNGELVYREIVDGFRIPRKEMVLVPQLAGSV